jgi:hypothetical protein
LYEEGFHMEKTETKSTIQTAAREAAESARKAGVTLRTLAGNAAEFSGRWAKRFGETLSDGARLAALEAKQTRLRRSLGRAYEQLGRAVYALHGRERGGPFAEEPELQADLQRVKESEATLDANDAELAELRKTFNRGESTFS